MAKRKRPDLAGASSSIEVGDLVNYRFWIDDEWVTDGLPHLVVRKEGGMAEVLMAGGLQRVPVVLLKKLSEDLSFFARTL